MKEKKSIRGSIALLFSLFFLINVTGIDSGAAEFHESRLPSQIFPQSYSLSPAQIPAESNMPQQFDTQSLEQTKARSYSDLPDAVYEKFRQDVKRRTQQDRKKLKEAFEKKAKQTSNKTEKAYYYRLIAILCELGIK
jgi:hypothetical protein